MKFRCHQVRAFRRIARLGILAVLLQILLPTFHHPAAATQYGPFADSTLCSSTGATVDRPGLPKNGSPHCPICWGLQQLAGGFTVPNAFIAPPFSLGAVLTNPLRERTAAPPLVARQAAQPRGPPILT